MTGKWDDDRLRRAFAELRAKPEADAPSFAAVVDAARKADARRAGTPSFARALAAAVVLVVGGGLWLGLASKQPPVAPLSEWRSPTEFLLASGNALAVPALTIIPSSPNDTRRHP